VCLIVVILMSTSNLYSTLFVQSKLGVYSYWTLDTTAEFREIFAMHDGDCDGRIPLKEMTTLLKDIGVTGVTEDEIAMASSSSSSNSSKLW